MIRYFFSLVLVMLGCTVLTGQAKETGTVTASHKTSPSATTTTKQVASTTTTKATTTTSTASTTPAKASSTSGSSVANKLKRSTSSSTKPSVTSSITSTTVTTTTTKQSTLGNIQGRLARLTAYWAGEGDYYTGRGMSSTGIRLHGGHCAVDPRIIPYGSVVEIAGIGTYLAVDTGSAVISREAARATGHTPEERGALVIDIYFESGRDGRKFAANGPKYATISWRSPRSADNQTKETRGLIAEENWNRSHSNSL